jgi:hypothetical protein
MRRMLGMVVALSLSAAALAACGDKEADDQDGSAASEFEIPVGDPAYDVDAPSWAVKTSIHVGDVEIPADPAPEVYVVTASGIYYVARNGSLYFTDGGPAEKVTDLEAGSLAVSADQQRLALIDRAHGPVDPYDAHVAVPVVFDLGTGEQVFRGRPGRDPDDDDLAALYSELPPAIIGLDDGAVYANDPLQEENETRFPLDGSAPAPIKGNPMLANENGIEGFAIERPKGRYEWAPTFTQETGDVVYSAVLSPAEDVFFTSSGEAGRYYDIETGDPTSFSETPFTLGGWVDDDTFYGAFSDRGSSEGPSGTTVIATCDVGKQPRCTRVSPEFTLPSRPILLFGTGNRFAF